jgi:hypothetical protein
MHNFSRTLTPEQFVAKVAIHADGSYASSYDPEFRTRAAAQPQPDAPPALAPRPTMH